MFPMPRPFPKPVRRGGTFLAASAALLLLAQAAPARTLLALPVTAHAEAADMLPAIDRLFRAALEARHGAVTSAPDAAPCAERACALRIAKDAGLSGRDEVVYSGLEKLGSKWIFLATVVRADG